MANQTKRRVAGGVCALSAAAALAYWWMNRETAQIGRIREMLQPDPLSSLESILETYARALFEPLYELAQTASRVRENLRSKNYESFISDEDLKQLLMTPDFTDTVDKCLEVVLKGRELKISREDFERFCSAMALNEPQIQKYKEAIQSMFEDAINGVTPAIPGLALPLDISEKEALALLDDVLRQKRLALTPLFQDNEAMKDCTFDPGFGFVPTEEASKMILGAAQEAERSALTRAQRKAFNLAEEVRSTKHSLSGESAPEDTLSSWNIVSEDDLVIAFKSLLGEFCKSSPAFIAERAALMARHTEQIVSLIKSALDPDEMAGIPDGLRSHPIAHRYGGISTVNLVTNIPLPASEEGFVYGSNVSDISHAHSWGYHTVCIITDNKETTDDEAAMCLSKKLNHLLLAELIAKIKVQPNLYEKVKFFELRCEEALLMTEIPEFSGRLRRLLDAVAQSDFASALPVMCVSSPDDGCLFATRDVEALFDRLNASLETTPSAMPTSMPLQDDDSSKDSLAEKTFPEALYFDGLIEVATPNLNPM